ncbi:hypothetical protein CEXT_678261 [Caerostris extrusa]|uniref:Uncharacterized protein n=1 Tax=Caerostris extrusa TaxID=172846 RepID=A0AAV4VQP8_CAEEX|nr:hypothetical protein CEXT_678261 [Caerostris extrusa]
MREQLQLYVLAHEFTKLIDHFGISKLSSNYNMVPPQYDIGGVATRSLPALSGLALFHENKMKQYYSTEITKHIPNLLIRSIAQIDGGEVNLLFLVILSFLKAITAQNHRRYMKATNPQIFRRNCFLPSFPNDYQIGVAQPLVLLCITAGVTIAELPGCYNSCCRSPTSINSRACIIRGVVLKKNGTFRVQEGRRGHPFAVFK